MGQLGQQRLMKDNRSQLSSESSCDLKSVGWKQLLEEAGGKNLLCWTDVRLVFMMLQRSDFSRLRLNFYLTWRHAFTFHAFFSVNISCCMFYSVFTALSDITTLHCMIILLRIVLAPTLILLVWCFPACQSTLNKFWSCSVKKLNADGCRALRMKERRLLVSWDVFISC